MTTTEIYVPITKFEENDDGTLSVHGKATGPDLDSDKQICDPTWLADAMPDWFTTGANVREMHSKIAAGVGEELTEDGDGWWLRSLVVDEGSCKKVRNKVLKGYSIGISGAQILKDGTAPNGRIVGGDIIEVSLVDRPANPTCKLDLAKSEGGSVVQVEELVKDDDGEDVEMDAAGDVAGSVEGEGAPDQEGGQDESYSNLPVVDPANDAAEETIVGQARTAIAMANQAITDLLTGEVEELQTGGGRGPIRVALYLLDDIDVLLSDLEWFVQCDADDDARQIADHIHATKGAVVLSEDITKAITAAVAPVVEKISALEDKVTKAVDDEERGNAFKALTAEVAEVRQDITKVLESPTPGGPALTAPSVTTASKAAYYREQAALVEQANPDLATGYRSLADKAESTNS